MVKAGALMYSILILLIVSTIMSALLLSNYYHNRFLSQIIEYTRECDNLNSGVQWALINLDNVKEDQENIVTLFEDIDSEVNIEKRRWGGFYKVVVNSSNDHNNKKMFLAGNVGFKSDDVALVLINHTVPLSICGRTTIEGNCHVPGGRINRATLAGMSSVNAKVTGKQISSPMRLPEINPGYVEELKKLTKVTFTSGSSDSILYINQGFFNKDTIINSFANKTAILLANEKLFLQNNFLKGNLIIKSSETIEISSQSYLEDIIIIAPSVRVRNDFKGQLQIIALDSVNIDQRCYLSYPSAISIYNNKGGKIMIDDNSTVEGMVFNYSDIYVYNQDMYTSIGTRSCIRGFIYTNGIADIKGDIEGKLYAGRIQNKTSSSVYENYLVNVSISNLKLSNYYYSPVIFKESEPKQVIKWLF